MSSQPPSPSSLVLTRRLADGTVEWIPLEVPQRVTAAPDAAYALIDRADYEAPQALVALRQGEDLLVEVQGAEVLVLEDFFTTEGVAFHPITDVAGGAGPFSGSPLTADSPILLGYSDGEQVVWSAEPGERDQIARAEAGEGGSSAILWGGLAAGGLGLAVAAGGGGGGSGGGNEGANGGDGAGGADTAGPQITSGNTAEELAENSGPGQVVYRATASEMVTWSLESAGDAAAFSVDADTGAVTLVDDPDFETRSSYDITVVATDTSGNSSRQVVSLSIRNLDEVPPTITSGATASPIEENSGAGQVVYTVTSTDDDDIATGSTVYSLGQDLDADHFDIDADTGAVTLKEDPDYEAKSSYDFTVVATDAAGNSNERSVSLAIEDVDDEKDDDDDDDEDKGKGKGKGDDDDDKGGNGDGGDVPTLMIDSSRIFEDEVGFDISIRDDQPSAMTDGSTTWSGAAGLGSDDRINLAGDGNVVQAWLVTADQMSSYATAVGWNMSSAFAPGTVTKLPQALPVTHGALTNSVYLNSMPAGMLTSQGLA